MNSDWYRPCSILTRSPPCELTVAPTLSNPDLDPASQTVGSEMAPASGRNIWSCVLMNMACYHDACPPHTQYGEACPL